MAMNPGSGTDRDDTMHDAGLARAYRATAVETPAPRLDDAIRAAARRVAGSGPRPLPRLAAWRLPLSLAAVVVLSVTVVLMMREEGIDTLLQPEQTPPVRKEAPPAAAAVTAPEPPAVAAPRSRPGAPVALPEPAPHQHSKVQVQPVPENVADGIPLAAQEAPPAAQTEARSAETPRAMMRAAPAGSAPPADNRAAAPAGTPPESRLWQDLVEAPPEQWIRRITELRREGRVADADALLAEFRKRYPDWPVPEALR